MCPALTWHRAWHGVGQHPGSAKAPRSGRVVPCGDIEPVPFRLPIQVAPPKRAATPAQLAPSAPAGASSFPRVPAQLAPNAPWTLQPVAPQPSPALRYLPGATGGIPGPQASGRPSVPGGGLNTLSPRPRFFPTGPAPPHRQPEGGIPPRPPTLLTQSTLTTHGSALRGATLCPTPRVTSASQGLLGLPHATEGSTSPPWERTPACRVHLALTARGPAPECPGSARHTPTAQPVCPGALDTPRSPRALLFPPTSLFPHSLKHHGCPLQAGRGARAGNTSVGDPPPPPTWLGCPSLFLCFSSPSRHHPRYPVLPCTQPGVGGPG